MAKDIQTYIEKPEELTGDVLFRTPETLQSILDSIEEQARSIVPDVRTAKGRKAIASNAAKVARSKTFLDDIGKKAVAGLKKKASVVDAQRRELRSRLDSLKAEVRKPLTDIEEAEARAREEIQWRIQRMKDVANEAITTSPAVMSYDDIIQAIARVEGVEINDSFGEFQADAAKTRDAILYRLGMHRDEIVKIAAKRRAEEVIRKRRELKEREEREKRIAERAAREAEERVKAKLEEEQRLRDLEARMAQEKLVAEQKREQEARVEAQRREDAIRRQLEQAQRETEKKERKAREEIARLKAEAERKEAANKAKDVALADSKKKTAVAISKHAGIGVETAMRVVEAITDGKIPGLRLELSE